MGRAGKGVRAPGRSASSRPPSLMQPPGGPAGPRPPAVVSPRPFAPAGRPRPSPPAKPQEHGQGGGAAQHSTAETSRARRGGPQGAPPHPERTDQTGERTTPGRTASANESRQAERAERLPCSQNPSALNMLVSDCGHCARASARQVQAGLVADGVGNLGEHAVVELAVLPPVLASCLHAWSGLLTVCVATAGASSFQGNSSVRLGSIRILHQLTSKLC